MTGRTVELRGPADEAFVRLVRGATLAVANQAGFAVDPCDELRVAADEACNVLIASGASELVVVLHDAPPLLTLSLCASNAIELSMDTVAELVLSTMVDRVRVEAGGTIVLHKATPALDPSRL